MPGEKKRVAILQDTLERGNPWMPPLMARSLLSGTLEKKGTGFLLTYEENVSDDPDSPDMTIVHLHVTAGRVMLMREGSIQSTMVFERKHHYETRYRIPYGEVMLRIQTTVLEANVDFASASGNVHLEYQLVVDAGEPTYRTMNIRFAPPEHKPSMDSDTLFHAFTE